MTVQARLALGMGSLLILTLLTGVISTLALRATAESKDEVAIGIGQELAMAERLRYRAEHVVATSRAYLLTGDPLYANKFHAARRDLEAGLDSLEARADAGAVGHVERVRESGRAYVEGAERATRWRSEASDSGAVMRYFEGVLEPARDAFDRRLDELVDHERAAFQEELRRSRASADRAGLAIAVATSLGLLLGAGLGVAFARRFAEQFRREQEASRDAKRSAAAKEEILTIVAHDLRNPVSAILLTASYLERNPAVGREKLRGRIAAIQRAADRMQHMIEDLLEAARIDGGTIELRSEECDAGQMLRQVAQLFELKAAQKQVRIVEEPPSTSVSVSADRERLLRVLSNLVGNALKFIPDGGEISVRAERSDTFVRFSVRDTGPGIFPEQIPHLFERHWQARRSGTDGLGLGLHIAKSLIQAHGGEIWVETRPGQGSTFLFTVPVAAAPRGGAAGGQPPGAEWSDREKGEPAPSG